MVKLFPALRGREMAIFTRFAGFRCRFIAFGNPLSRALPIGARKYRFSLLPSVL